jgi:hypothetical protein
LSSIGTTSGAKPLVSLAHGALQLGIFHAPAQDIQQIEVLAPDPQLVQTLKSLSSVALLAVSQLCTMRSKTGISAGA